MIWPFRPHPPLPLASKVACERRFQSIGRTLGKNRISGHTVVAPQDIDPLLVECESDELPRRLFDFVARRMMPARSLDIRWGHADAMTSSGEAQPYQLETDDDGVITGIDFHPSLVHYPYRLAAVTAGAAAECLVRSGSLTEDFPIGIFEVLPLFFGLGPIMANAALHENAEEANGIQSWEHSRVGTVSPLEFGYTMALCDWSVSTEYDQISSLLRLDAKEGIEKGGRFLRKTSDCIFEKDFLEHSTDNTIGFLATRLANRSNSIQLSTLIDLYQSENVDSDLLPDIARLLGHSEPEIQKLAAITLGRCKDLPETIHDEVLLLAENGPPSVRRAAVSSLRPGYGNDDATLEFLTDLLRRSDAAMTATCVGTLMKYDVQSEDLTDALMKGLAKMVLTSGNNDLSSGIELLRRIHSDPADEIRQYFEDDPSALAILNELLQESHEPDTVTSSETK